MKTKPTPGKLYTYDIEMTMPESGPGYGQIFLYNKDNTPKTVASWDGTPFMCLYEIERIPLMYKDNSADEYSRFMFLYHEHLICFQTKFIEPLPEDEDA